MKRTLIVLGVLIVLVYSTVANAGIGFKGGITLAKWNGDGLKNADEYSWKKGVELGAYYAFPINDYFTVQPEMLYSMKGWDYVYVGHNSSEHWSLSYVDISVLSKFTMLTGDAFRPTVFAGPYMGYLLNTKAGMTVGDQSLSADLPDDIFKSVEAGLIFGVGFDFEGSKAAFTLEARYNMGLTQVVNMKDNINNLQLLPVFNKDGRVKNQTFSILVGVRF